MGGWPVFFGCSGFSDSFAFSVDSEYASMAVSHAFAVTTFFNCAVDKGGSGLLTGASFSAAAFHSLTLTCCPCGVTRSAVHHFVWTRRSGYSYPWKIVSTEPSDSLLVTHAGSYANRTLSGHAVTARACSLPGSTWLRLTATAASPLPSSYTSPAYGGSVSFVPRDCCPLNSPLGSSFSRVLTSSSPETASGVAWPTVDDPVLEAPALAATDRSPPSPPPPGTSSAPPSPTSATPATPPRTDALRRTRSLRPRTSPAVIRVRRSVS